MKSGILFALVGLATFGIATTEVEGRCLLAQILKLKKHPPPDSPVQPTPTTPPVTRPPIVDVDIVKGKDGKDGRDGSDGKDGLPGPPGKDAPPVDLSPILEAIAKLNARLDAVAEKAGKEGPPGPPGKDAPPVDLSAIAAAIAKLELRIDGIKPGQPTPVDIDKIADEVKKKLPPYPVYFEITPLSRK